MIIKGLKINFETIGEGKPFLILPGWGSQSNKWQRVGELLARENIKVIIPDLPGFGKSEKPKTAWNLDDYCEFVEEFVKSLNLEKFYLLGHSFGGALAVKYSLKFASKINKLFLVGAACIRRKNFKIKLFKFISKFFKIKNPFLRKVFYRKSDYLSVEGIMKEIYLKIIREDLTDILSQVRVPTVIIWGEKDKTTPIKQANLINFKIKNSKLKIIPNIGHNPHLESPKELSSLILKELSSLKL